MALTGLTRKVLARAHLLPGAGFSATQMPGQDTTNDKALYGF
jgi:hypothetical protein